MVLVVDDNHYMRVIVSTMLRSMGINLIREASDGIDALEIVRDWRPDVVIIDLMMEQLDGVEFTKLVRRGVDSPNPYVPIIMMTGHTDRRHVIDARDAGVSEFIAKPLTARADRPAEKRDQQRARLGQVGHLCRSRPPPPQRPRL